MKTRRDVFQAIADPTRRKIILLLISEPHNLNALAENFDVTRQAISLHIKILTECGLIAIKKQGRERYCEVEVNKLSEISLWVEECRKIYEEQLDALENYLKKLQNVNN